MKENTHIYMVYYPMYFLCACVTEYLKENVEDKIKPNEKKHTYLGCHHIFIVCKFVHCHITKAWIMQSSY